MHFVLFQEWLTVKHPCFKQNKCSLKIDEAGSVSRKCNKPLERRVTFKMSRDIYSRHTQHLPVGSGTDSFSLNTTLFVTFYPGQVFAAHIGRSYK